MNAERRIEQHLAFVTHNARAAAAPHLGPGRTAASVRDAVAAVLAVDAQVKAALVTQLPRDPKALPVCAPGCDYCCYLSVFASVPELFFLADHLGRTWSSAELTLLIAEVGDAARAFAPMTQGERAASRRPCPLLDEGARRCRVYDARPLACRAYNSCDAGVCARAFEYAEVKWDMPVDLFQLTASRNARVGLMKAVHAAGLDPGPYELAPGLHVALTVPDVEARWLAGEDVFAAAETTLGRERRQAWRASFTA